MSHLKGGRAWLAIGLPTVVGLLLTLLIPRLLPTASPLLLRLPVSLIPLAAGLLISASGLIGYWLAQSAQRQTNEALNAQQVQQNSDRRRFMQRLDHEFKNPLTVIRGGLSSLSTHRAEGSVINPADQKGILTSVTNQTMRLVRLTSDLRKIADLESRPLETSDVDLTALLTEVQEVISEKLAEDQRELILSIPRAPWPLPTIIGDWDLLFLSFYNLADNARKFSTVGDTIEIRAREEDETIVVEVADTGAGIPDEERPHVWEELYRGENGHAVSGSGLGLPLVKAIVERHAGKISLTSRRGQGTNVTVALPTNGSK